MAITITDELLKQCVSEFRKQQAAKQLYQDYYDGKHDILKNYTFNLKRANQKIVVNFFRKFLHDEHSYALGNPVNYIDKQGNTEYVDRIDTDFSTWEKVHNKQLMIEAGKFGHSYELRYIRDNEFKATVLTPLECFVLEGNDADRTVQLAMHFYKENQFSDQEKCDLYLPNQQVIHYNVDDKDNLTKTGESSHAFPTVPVSVVGANTERKSMLDDIKSLNDSLNTTISNMVNELSDFRLALLKVIGTKFENDDDISKMVEKGVIQFQKGADIDYLIKELPSEFADKTLNEIKENIYKQASHIDTNEKMQSNISGVALRSRLITLENKCTNIQTMLEQCIKSRLKQYFYILRIRENTTYDYRNIRQKFTMNVPQDLLHLADVASKLKDIVSLETLYSLFPFVESPSLEYQKWQKQQQDLMRQQEDLDSIE